MAGPAHLQHTLTKLDPRVDRTVLLVTAVDHERLRIRVPLNVERDGYDRAERTNECLHRIVEQHTMRLVPEAPLPERCIAVVTRPHLGRLQLESGAQPDSVELLDVEVRQPGTNQTRPIVEALAAQLEADEHADVGGFAPTPPPPTLDRGISMSKFVRIGEHARQTMGVIRYLSLEWLEALSADVAAHAELQQLATTHRIGITQAILDGPDGTVIYHLQVGDGVAAFGWGSALPEDVRMEQSWDTAVAVATGTLNAQEAFIKGRIKLTGNQQLLSESAAVFGALDQVFSSLRERTDYR